MFIRKFEAETLEEALSDIKKELGPDAIILKTITNKGLKGAFKKKRIEITAAISEKSYVKKARVDQVLPDEAKEKFYQAPSQYISNMIDNHSENVERPAPQTASAARGGYGSMGLNKPVKQAKEIGAEIASKIKNGLDDFLVGSASNSVASKSKFDSFLGDEEEEEFEIPAPRQAKPVAAAAYERQAAPRVEEAPAPKVEAKPQPTRSVDYETRAELEGAERKISELEKKLFELSKVVERLEKREPEGIYQLRTTLKSLDIADRFVQYVTRQALFDLNEREVQDPDAVFEFALKEMMKVISVNRPLFSTLEDKSAITVLVSDDPCGQSSMIQKLSCLNPGSVVIRNGQKGSGNLSESLFGVEVHYASNLAEVMSCVRKSSEAGKQVFIDYKANRDETNETKKFIEGLKRSFANVEVLICLSAIHSELYNRKVISRYMGLSNGAVITFVDQCLNFGSLFNITECFEKLPFVFFGTGPVVPEDIEAASAERILAGVFQLN